MAVHKSAKKRIRRNGKRAIINKSRISEMRTLIRKVEEAIKAGKSDEAREALKAAQSKIHRAAQKGIIHARTAARKISRLSARIKAIKA
ncbi:MAG: 30S ribosomal protein S20 [Alphaproteobacteria bacterium]|nr:30S ribosomal protein S20 [Alphaproteobacteria bacterium]